MPVGSAFHERTAPLAESLSFRDWAGYYAVSSYETHHDHEYNAIRNACGADRHLAALQVPLHGPRATRLVDRVITRDAAKLAVGQVCYTPWCDEDGTVIDDGTVTRVAEETYRWTAAIRTCAGWCRTRAGWTWRSRTSPSRWRHWRCRGRPPRAAAGGVRGADSTA